MASIINVLDILECHSTLKKLRVLFVVCNVVYNIFINVYKCFEYNQYYLFSVTTKYNTLLNPVNTKNAINI